MTDIFFFATLDLVRLFHAQLVRAGLSVILLFIAILLPGKKVVYAQNSATATPEIIVVFKHKPTVSVLSAFSNSTTQNLEIKNGITASNAMVFSVTTGDVQTVMQNIAKDPTVSAVFPNYKLNLYSLPNDTYIAATPAPGLPRQQWNMFNLKLAGTGNSAWDVTKGSPSVVLAVIDTGTNSTHPDFAGKFASLVDCVNGTCAEISTMNDNFPGGHGTHVAGLAGAATNNGEGIASSGYNTKLMIIRVMDANGETRTDNFLNAMRWAADHGAKVINSSFGIVEDSIGSGGIDEFNSAVAYAWGKGAVVVAAAGNCRGNTNGRKGCEIYPNGDITNITGYAQNSKVYPAASPNVISVAATLVDNSMASYSEQNDSSNNNLKNWVDVAAPGGDGECSNATKSCIYSTIPTNQYGWDSGTSMASPQVAGVAALVFAANPGITNQQVKCVIENTANPNIAKGPTNNGLVDALAAVSAKDNSVVSNLCQLNTLNISSTPTPTGAAVSTTPNLTPSPTPSVTPILSITPSPGPTVAVSATPTTGPTATPTVTPYPTTGVSSRLPKTAPNPYPSGPYCAVTQLIRPPPGPDCCNISQINQNYKCIQNCGPPVVSADSSPPSYSCLSPQQQANRAEFGCPICLASNTVISTPDGNIRVTELKAGMSVWTVDRFGNKVEVPIFKTSSVTVPYSHKVTHLILSDGRSLWVSPGHPTANGKSVGQLKSGDKYDGSVIVSNDLQSYWDTRTYDILPAGDTGYYWANGILIGSTLKK